MHQTYQDLIDSEEFKDNLEALNGNLKDSFAQTKYPPMLVGNLFYNHHKQVKPRFYEGPLEPTFEDKRIRFFKVAQRSTKMFEVGVNGGHSSFLALSANPSLEIWGNDFAQPWCDRHPEVYVPAAVNTLQQLYPGQFHYLEGNCLTKVPEFVRQNPDLEIDMVHLDGAKDTYRKDFLNLRPILKKGALIVVDDTNNRRVMAVVDELIRKKICKKLKEFPSMSRKKYTHTNEIIQYV